MRNSPSSECRCQRDRLNLTSFKPRFVGDILDAVLQAETVQETIGDFCRCDVVVERRVVMYGFVDAAATFGCCASCDFCRVSH